MSRVGGVTDGLVNSESAQQNRPAKVMKQIAHLITLQMKDLPEASVEPAFAVLLNNGIHPIYNIFRFSLPEKNLIPLFIMNAYLFAFKSLKFQGNLFVFYGKFPGGHHAVWREIEGSFMGFEDYATPGYFDQLSGFKAIGVRHLTIHKIACADQEKDAKRNP